MSAGWTGTLHFEQLLSGDWVAIDAYPFPIAGQSAVQSATATGDFFAPNQGCNRFRARLNPASSGAATVTLSLGTPTPPTPQSISVGTVSFSIGDMSITTVAGQPVASGSGTTTTGTLRVVLPTDQTVIPVTVTPAATGGLSSYSKIWPGNAAGDSIKTSPGQVMSLHFGNDDSIPYWARLYDIATIPVASDSPSIKERYYIPVGGGDNLAVNPGTQFSTGIGIRLSGGIADNDSTTVTASKVVVTLGYK